MARNQHQNGHPWPDFKEKLRFDPVPDAGLSTRPLHVRFTAVSRGRADTGAVGWAADAARAIRLGNSDVHTVPEVMHDPAGERTMNQPGNRFELVQVGPI